MYYVYDNKGPDTRLRVLSSWAAAGKENKRDIYTFVPN